MANTQRVGSHCTTVVDTPTSLGVTYHNTTVVHRNEGKITLNSGGWRTATTKTRMNQVSNQFDLGFLVFAKNGVWYVRYNGAVLPFSDGMVL